VGGEQRGWWVKWGFKAEVSEVKKKLKIDLTVVRTEVNCQKKLELPGVYPSSSGSGSAAGPLIRNDELGWPGLWISFGTGSEF
jgi:hypothetical protein